MLKTNATFKITQFPVAIFAFDILRFGLGFLTGRDSAIFRDKGTEAPSLSLDKGTTGQAQNLAMGRAWTGF